MMVFKEIEGLIYYATAHLMLDELDVNFVRNRLLDELKLADYIITEVDYEQIEAMTNPDAILSPIVAHAVGSGIIKESEAENFADKLMSIVSLNPSQIADIFDNEMKMRNPIKATEWLYDYCIKNNSVKSAAIAKNRHWDAKATRGKLEITINLSKPEKNNADVAKAALSKGGYPECAICAENIGYVNAGKANLRYVPLSLDGDDWFMMFSPYSYFNQHLIAVNYEHIPMQVNADTLSRLLDFSQRFPHYFIGCNAAIPRVGGSILAHDHFQGGYKILPMFKAGDKQEYKSKEYPLVSITEIDWYNNVLRLVCHERKYLEELALKIIDAWNAYSNESVGILAKTSEQHNAVAPIVRRDKEGKYIAELILRNNRTDENHPNGIFHAHDEYHNIKSEAIGLIEAMGLFILPGRLEAESAEIEKFLIKPSSYDAAKLSPQLKPHARFIEKLLADVAALKLPQSDKLTALEAQLMIKDEISAVCERILENTAVFKADEAGRAAFLDFLSVCGITPKGKN